MYVLIVLQQCRQSSQRRYYLQSHLGATVHVDAEAPGSVADARAIVSGAPTAPSAATLTAPPGLASPTLGNATAPRSRELYKYCIWPIGRLRATAASRVPRPALGGGV